MKESEYFSLHTTAILFQCCASIMGSIVSLNPGANFSPMAQHGYPAECWTFGPEGYCEGQCEKPC